MTEVLPWLFGWACRASTIDFCPALAALVSPVHIIISPHCPEPGQAVVRGRLSLCLCLQPLCPVLAAPVSPQYEEPPCHCIEEVNPPLLCITPQLLPVPVYIAFF